jgi:putative Mg2+ transporter-C (MgtC) family protein
VQALSVMTEPETLVLRLAVAVLLGGAIGLERERSEKTAGLRTHALVALGSGLFTIVSGYGFTTLLGPHVSFDPSRIAAQVATGIGFLGAGTIIFRREIVHGLTTAASIWTVAAIGVASCAGLFIPATAATVFALLILVAVKPLERIMGTAGGHDLLSLTFDPALTTLQTIEHTISGQVAIERVEVQTADQESLYRVDVVLHWNERERILALIQELGRAPGVKDVRSTIDLSAAKKR